jgi:hypothetical protein
MSFQRLFRRFHEAIQLKQFDENAELREKRDRVLRRLRDGLTRTFTSFNQGSYAMGTGIKPLNGDYDIDIGILFNDVYIDEHDPVEVKGWVYQAVNGHTERVEWRRPCVTVFYRQAGETIYHVDLAIFARRRYGTGEYLAIGKQHSSREQCEWQLDDRKGFMDVMANKYSGEDAAQLRRVIRYLKRWKAVHFPSHGHAAPTGLALTVAAYYWFQPARDWNREYDDLSATHALVQRIIQGFMQYWDGNQIIYRISLQFPQAPHDDVFARMTDQQMQEFYQRLQKLDEWLRGAQQSGDVFSLKRAFGNDFPEE